MMISMAKPHFRAFERRGINLPAKLLLPAGTVLDVRVHNLGLGGAAVDSREYLQPGARLEFELEPANLWDPLRLGAEVAWVREAAKGFILGLMFRHESSRATVSLLGLLTTDAYT